MGTKRTKKAEGAPSRRTRGGKGGLAQVTSAPPESLEPAKVEAAHKLKILMLEDEPNDAELARHQLCKAGLDFAATRVDTRAAFVEALESFAPDIVLADYNLPDFNGAEALKHVRRTHPDVPVIMVTGALGDEGAIALLKDGAADYVLKDNLVRLPAAIKRAIAAAPEVRGRRAAEQQLRESEEKFRTVAEAAQDAIIMVDSTDTILYWNASAARMLGYSAGETVGRKLHDWITPTRYREAAEAGLRGFATTGKGGAISKTLELAALRKDGVEIPVEISLTAVPTDGEWRGIGILRDISERKATEMALRQSEEKFRGIVETSNDCIWEIDASDTYTYASPAITTLLGYQPEEVVGKRYFDFMLTPEAARVTAAFQPIKDARKPFAVLPNVLTRKDGTEVFVETSGVPIFADDGSFKGYRGIDRDVTERERAKQKQALDAAMLAAVQNTSPDGILLVDRQAQILSYNERFVEMFAIPPELIAARADARVLETVAALAADPAAFLARVLELYRLESEIGREEIALKDGRTIDRYTAPVKRDDGTYLGRVWFFRDISERKASEQALRLSEAQLSNALQMARAAPWSYDVVNDRITLNDGFYRIFGVTAEEVGGYSMSAAEYAARFCHPEDAPLIAKEIGKAVAAEDGTFTDEFEYRTNLKGGAVGYVTVRFFIVKDKAGKTVTCTGVVQNITERKLAEQAILESETQFRSLVEQEIAGIFIVGADGLVTYMNAGFSQMHGYRPDEAIGRPILDFIPQSEKQEVARHFAAQIAGKPISNQMTTVIQRKDGGRVDVLVHGGVSTYRGKPALFGVVIDITALRQAERKTAESELRLRTVLHTATDGIAMLDAKTRKFMFANRAFGEMLGYSAEELGTLGLEDVHPPEVIAQARKGFAQNLKGKTGGISDLPMKRKDGSTFMVEIHGSPMKYDGRACLVAVFHDVTERNRTEQTLLRMNRTLATLSACDATLVHATSEADLLRDMCKVVVERGGYRMAWIGFSEHDVAKTVMPVAWAGEGTDYVTGMNIRWADVARGRGPSGEAIRTGEAQICQNIGADSRMTPWMREAKKHGFASSAAFPLKDSTGVFGTLTIFAAEADAFDDREVTLLAELANDLAYGIRSLRDRTERETAVRQWRDSIEATIGAISTTVEMRDPYTAGHQRRVAQLAVAMGRELGMSEDHIHGLFLAGIVHDVGKIQVPAEILNKPGKLSKLEYQLIQQHAQAGYDIIKDIEFPWPIARMVLQHHERLDGSGYPNGLKGDEILAEAKILAIADVVEAMTSHRPYRAALGLDKALEEIELGKGRLYDPASADACIRVFRDKSFAFS